jgi:ankyrin repeat protein
MKALHIAAESGSERAVEWLLAHGHDPNAKEEGDNATALHFAAERGHLGTVRLLVEAGADVNDTSDSHERGPLGWALVFTELQLETAAYLMSKGAKPDIFCAIALGDRKEVEKMVNEHPEWVALHLAPMDGWQTPLEFAATRGKWDIAEFIASREAALTLRELAAMGRTEELAERIGADPDHDVVQDAFRASVRAGRVSSARVLLLNGAAPNDFGGGGSAMFDAVGHSDEAMIRLLVEFGGDLESHDPIRGSTPLGWQVFFGHPLQVETALRCGARPQASMVELAQAGARGDLRRYSSGSPEGFLAVKELIEDALG